MLRRKIYRDRFPDPKPTSGSTRKAPACTRARRVLPDKHYRFIFSAYRSYLFPV